MATTKEQREAIQRTFPGATSFTRTSTGEKFLKFQGRDIPFEQALAQAGGPSQGDLAQGRTTVLTTTTPELQGIERQIRDIAGTTAGIARETGQPLQPEFRQTFPVISKGFNVAPPPPVDPEAGIQVQRFIPPAPATAQPIASNLFEFYEQRRPTSGIALPSVAERSQLYEAFGLGTQADYIQAAPDNVEENQRLLAELLRRERQGVTDQQISPPTKIPDTIAPPKQELLPKEQKDAEAQQDAMADDAISRAQAFAAALDRQREDTEKFVLQTRQQMIEAFQAGRRKEVERLEGELQVSENQERLNTLRTLIAEETTSYLEAKRQIEGRAIFRDVKAGILKKLQRERLFNVQIWQAEAQALQGSIKDANKTIDRALDLKFMSESAFLNNMNSMLGFVERAASAREKNQIFVFKEMIRQEEAVQKAAKKEQGDVLKLKIKYPRAGIDADDTLIEANQKALPFATEAEQLDIRGKEALIQKRLEPPQADTLTIATRTKRYPDLPLSQVGRSLLEITRELESEDLPPSGWFAKDVLGMDPSISSLDERSAKFFWEKYRKEILNKATKQASGALGSFEVRLNQFSR